jgi:hypothetical protein
MRFARGKSGFENVGRLEEARNISPLAHSFDRGCSSALLLVGRQAPHVIQFQCLPVNVKFTL